MCTYIHMYICTYVHMYTYTCTCTCTCICICICTCIYVYIYIHIYLYNSIRTRYMSISFFMAPQSAPRTWILENFPETQRLFCDIKSLKRDEVLNVVTGRKGCHPPTFSSPVSCASPSPLRTMNARPTRIAFRTRVKAKAKGQRFGRFEYHEMICLLGGSQPFRRAGARRERPSVA